VFNCYTAKGITWERTAHNMKIQSSARWLASGAGIAAAAYCSYAAYTWFRYGHPRKRITGDNADPLLDRFMPDYEVVERHQARITAPAGKTLMAACNANLKDSPFIRAIFNARTLIMGSREEDRQGRQGLLVMTKAMGWGMLAETPGREIVMGAVTRPWHANVVFRALQPETFAAFREPDYVKIAWTLRADPVTTNTSIFRTETRAMATDAGSRAKFRLYWSLFSPGIWLVRRLALGSLRKFAVKQ
jgi:hypothetical protein